MSAKAIAKNIRISPRKVRLVTDIVRGKSIKEANDILTFTNKSASPVVLKVINSAAANAVNNHEMSDEGLYISEIYVNEGPRLKRFMPRARGSANAIIKRTSHIVVVVDNK